MRTLYYCETCDEQFQTLDECLNHEERCGSSITKWCFKCGKTHEWKSNDVWSSAHYESWHNFNLGRIGYGSGLDGSDVRFEICDECLLGFINTFTLEGQEKIHNSGSNTYLSTEDWLRVHRHEMPDEEMEEKGMYSPRQRKAYEERFPVCSNVHIREYSDGSRGSRCIKNASGERDGTASEFNISRECFGCSSFKAREEGIEIPVIKVK